MHPAVVVVIVLGGVFVSWGAYEAINTLYEWHNDRKEQREYEEYVRMHAEKSRSGVPVNTYQEESDEEDNYPLGFWKQKRDSLNSSRSELRRRNNPFSDMEQLSSNYELSKMERSISNRKSLLEREKELLLKEEAELERQRQLLRSRGNSIIGVIDDQEENSNPFTGSFVLDAQASNESLSTKNISSALSDKSDLDSWSDIHEIQVMRQRSDSSESFESIHHHQL